ncbi:MAG: acyl--CoA ligase [Gammaproteobacteria bacterium]|nr:acyl--CoA ligase [Gammaproteobacteria bacterium]
METDVYKLPLLLETSVAKYGDRTALITEDERWTYKEVADQVDLYARALVAQGVGKGTRLGLLLENTPEWIFFSFAATGLGAIVSPISTFARQDEIAYQTRHSDVQHLFMSARFLKADYQAVIETLVPELQTASGGSLYNDSLPALRKVTIRNSDQLPAAAQSWDDFLASADSVPLKVVQEMRADVDPEDECYLLYTSGTTANPKGVYHRHKSIARNGTLIGRHQQLNEEDVVWFYYPFFFCAGCVNVLLGTFSSGASLIVEPTFSPESAINLIDRENATTWHLWPHQVKAVVKHPDWQTKDHSSLHKGTGSLDLMLKVGDRFGGVGGVNMYGMTETCTAFACTHADEPREFRSRTCGKVMGDNQVRIVDSDTGEELEMGSEGEICVKGPSVMRRYYKMDPMTTFDEDGFFHTGDLGHLHENSRLHFNQRKKDMIKSGGINISPADIESTLSKLEGAREVYAFPLPGGDRGEIVGAALVLAEDDYDRDKIVEYCRDKFSAHKRPAKILLIRKDDIPMTGSGKVQKVKLAEMLQSESEKSSDKCLVV